GIQVHSLTLKLFSGSGFFIWSVTLIAIGVVLLSRLALVLVLLVRSWIQLPRWATREGRPVLVRQPLPRAWSLIIFWSGLRGALSLALVLALPAEIPARSVLVISTYAVVLFTLLVQGLSLRWVLRRFLVKKSGQVLPPGPPEETAIIEDTPSPQ
ncbi:MAG TPA: cation:proton antiporter, partial [Ktedonobacteraceae bacterium]|nr:cation:proton antiporter [Ktedonobacteraceae bacterium]